MVKAHSIALGIRNNYRSIVGGFLVLLLLYLTTLYSYILFHSFAELFSIVVATSIFIIAWNSRRLLDNNYLLFVGIAYMFVGGIDLMHTLAYKGMGVFTGYGSNLATELWIAARYTESISLLVAPIFLGRKLPARLSLIGYFAWFGLVLLSIFYWDIFPDAFIEGKGLTTFKVASEYVICLILLGALALLVQRRKFFEPNVVRLIAASIVVTIFQELAFTLYIDPYGLLNQVGHYLKIVAFYLVYKALIETGLLKPYSLLFRELKQSEERFRLMVDGAKDYVIFMLDPQGKVASWNDAAERIKGYRAEEILGEHFSRFYPAQDRESGMPEHELKVALESGSHQEEGWHLRKDGSQFWASVVTSALVDETGDLRGFARVVRDMTERRKAEEEREELAARIQLLLNSTDEGIYGIDLDGYCTFMNKASAEMLDHSQDEVLGKNMHTLAHHSHPDGSPYPIKDCPILQSVKTGQGLRVDTEVFWRKDGTYFPVEVSSYPVIKGETIEGAVIAFTDISERKIAEELSSALAEINGAIIATLDFDEIMQQVTERAAKALGADAAATSMREDGRWIVSYAYGFTDDVIGIRFTDESSKVTALAASAKKPISVNNAQGDERVNSELMKRHGVRSFFSIPLLLKDDVIAVLDMHYRTGQVSFNDWQIDFANMLSTSVSLALENVRLYQAEHRIADTLQSAILTVPKSIPGIDFGYLYRSATEIAKIGGDFYDFFELDNNQVGFVIGDVSGKGIEAAAITSMVKNTIRAFAYRNSDPSYVLAETNSPVERQLEPGQFVTAIYGVLDTETGKIVMSSAGHPDPFICGSHGCLQRQARRNQPLGILPGVEFKSFEAKLDYGDTVVLYTDGLIEAKGKGELFGDERVSEVLNAVSLESTNEIVDALLVSAEEFTDHKLSDDIAIIAFRYVGVANRLHFKISEDVPV